MRALRPGVPVKLLQYPKGVANRAGAPRPAPARLVTTVAAGGSSCGGASSSKVVWLATSNQDVLTAGLEAGVGTVVFGEGQASLAQEWQQLGRFEAITRTEDGRLLDASGAQVGRVRQLASPEDLRAAEREAAVAQGVVLMDASDWQIIPAENLVAAYQHNGGATLLAAAPDCASSRVMLEALQAGTDGVLLQTDSPAEVRALMRYLQERQQQGAQQLRYHTATVLSVQQVGMGDRACVDLCSLLHPGEGLLVGSFSRALFLVHSECAESRYIASRPFRVNAGPVHSYLQLPGSRTGYLSELKSGAEVLVAGPGGTTRTALVGRVKIESRPLVLVEAELPDGDRCSVLLQNAETVRLVGPEPAPAAASSSGGGGGCGSQEAAGSNAAQAAAAAAAASSAATAAETEGFIWQRGGEGDAANPSSSSSSSSSGRRDGAAESSRDSRAAPPRNQQQAEQAGGHASWRTISVSELAPGHQLFVLRQEGARHTGVAIQESITER